MNRHEARIEEEPEEIGVNAGSRKRDRFVESGRRWASQKDAVSDKVVEGVERDRWLGY